MDEAAERHEKALEAMEANRAAAALGLEEANARMDQEHKEMSKRMNKQRVGLEAYTDDKVPGGRAGETLKRGGVSE